ncbi:MAG: GNAT family N-acetyltransferase [Pelomonas sp.]|nr:GNAT family N-acetyltransferase [Roseateles sp.]
MTAALRLRPTLLSDLDFVLAVEQDGVNQPFVTPWERTQHEGSLRFPDARHFIVEDADGAAGFVILQGCRSPHRAVELKRIVLARARQGRGLGRAAVRGLKRLAFEQLHAHRFWLDVRALNTRAFELYLSEGFVEEGRLRESVRVPASLSASGWDTLVVMAMLEQEFAARDAAGQEALP